LFAGNRTLPAGDVGPVTSHAEQYPPAIRRPVQVFHPSPLDSGRRSSGAAHRVEQMKLKITGSLAV
jgi:hypothetical protein